MTEGKGRKYLKGEWIYILFLPSSSFCRGRKKKKKEEQELSQL